ncbi:hypothetical protein VULLAG_LOCUS23331 [Vulpes lagopus]
MGTSGRGLFVYPASETGPPSPRPRAARQVRAAHHLVPPRLPEGAAPALPCQVGATLAATPRGCGLSVLPQGRHLCMLPAGAAPLQAPHGGGTSPLPAGREEHGFARPPRACAAFLTKDGVGFLSGAHTAT